MGKLIDGKWLVELSKIVGTKSWNFFGRVIETPIYEDKPSFSDVVDIVDEKIGDINIFAYPAFIADAWTWPALFRGVLTLDGVEYRLIAQRQATPGDKSW